MSTSTGSTHVLTVRAMRLEPTYRHKTTYLCLMSQAFISSCPDSNLPMATVSGLGPLPYSRANVLSPSIPSLTAAFAKMKAIATRVKLSYELTLSIAPMRLNDDRVGEGMVVVGRKETVLSRLVRNLEYSSSKSGLLANLPNGCVMGSQTNRASISVNHRVYNMVSFSEQAIFTYIIADRLLVRPKSTTGECRVPASER